MEIDPLGDNLGLSVQLIESKDGLMSPEFPEYAILQPVQAVETAESTIETTVIKAESKPIEPKKETVKTETDKKKIKKEKLKNKRKKKEAKKAAAAKKALKCTCKKNPKPLKQIPWKDIPPTLPNTSQQKILFKCGMCTFQTLNKEDIINHAEIHKNEVKPAQPIPKPEPCKKCSLKKKKSSESDNKCPHCNFCTTNKRSLKIHMHIHANKQYKCTNCGYAATDVKELIRHQQIHIDEKKCRTCKSVFYYREKPKKSKQLICKICFYPATTKTDLQLHAKSHKDIKPCTLPVPNSDYDTIVE